MIRRASYVAAAEANADTALILRLLQGTPNPPNETEESIGSRFDSLNEYHFIDTERKAAIRMVVKEQVSEIVIPYWMADRDVRPNMIPVLAVCSRKILTDRPEAALWPCWGSFPADPALSEAARDAASRADAESYRAAFPGVTVELQPDTKLWRGRTTLEDVVLSAERLVR